MKRSQYSESQIVGILKEADSGVLVRDVCRKYGISDATSYKWKSKYGGLEVSDVRRMRELEAENSQIKRMYADLSLENQALKHLISDERLNQAAKKKVQEKALISEGFRRLHF